MTIENIITIVAAVIGSGGFWALVSSKLQEKARKKSSEAKLIMGISYSKIIQLCEKHLAAGWIKTDDLHELEHYLYEPYKALGGNGTAEALMKQVKELPIEPDYGKGA